MNNPSRHNSDNCPDVDALGNYVDFPQAYPQLEEHIAQCQECQRIIQAYRQIDQAVAAVPPPSDGFTQRIQEACILDGEIQAAQHIPTVTPASRWRGVGAFLAKAAAVAVLCGLSALVGSRFTTPDSTTPVVASNSDFAMPEMAVAPTTTNNNHGEGFSYLDSQRLLSQNTPNQDSTISATANSWQNVSVSGDNDSAIQRLAPTPTLVIPERVQHVWIAHPSIKNVEQLERFEKEYPQYFKVNATDRENGVVTISTLANDETLQRFVDKFHHDYGWKLLSPTYPQPGAGAQTLFNAHPVQYTMKVVLAQ